MNDFSPPGQPLSQTGNHPSLLISMGMMSAAIIAYQLSLIQILSLVQWYHFAYLVISIALLGFGAAGTVLALARKWMLRNIFLLLPFLMLSCGLTMILVPGISQLSAVRFDSFLVFADYTHIGKLFLTYLIFLIPFFLGALSIGIIFDYYIKNIGQIYFANLAGSALGGILSLFLMFAFFPGQLPALIALLSLLAGMIIIPGKKVRSFSFKGKMTFWLLAIASIGLGLWKIIIPPKLNSSEFKDLSKTLLLPDAEIKLEKASPFGLLQAVTSPVLRYAPGLSLSAPQAAEVRAAIFLNGDWLGVIISPNDSINILKYTSLQLPYVFGKRENILVLSAGTGTSITHAIENKANRIVAVEANTPVLEILKNELSYLNDSLFHKPGIVIKAISPRSFLRVDTSHYDLINLPIVGSFGGSAGIHAVHEQFLLTKEAFREMWVRLRPGGVISVTAWMDYPPRHALKILSTLIETLENLGIDDPRQHIAAIRSWGTISFILSKSSISETEIKEIRKFCEEMQFDPALLPGVMEDERMRYHQLQDTSFFPFVDRLFLDKKKLYTSYDFNIVPATDDRPYFSQFLRWKSLNQLSDTYGERTVPFLELGYLLVILTLLQVVIIAIVLILLPLFKLKWKSKKKWHVVLYFSGIGLGYMFVEMVLIQHFILYLGHPVYATSAVITSLLLFSGVGSYFSFYLNNKKNIVPLLLGTIVLLLLMYTVFLTPILRQSMQVGLSLKLLLILIMVGPLAFCMGIAFPLGLQKVQQIDASFVPWAWGINGCWSVISTVLATVISVEAGFKWVMLIAAIAYVIALAVWLRWRNL